MKNLIYISIAFLVLTSCSGHHSRSSAPSYGAYDNTSAEDLSASASSETSEHLYEKTSVQRNHDESKKEKSSSEITSRLIIYNANLDLKVKVLDSIPSKIKVIASNNQGYVSSVSNHRISLKVKAELLDQAIKEIAKLGKVTSKNVSSNDITDSYRDSEIRLENALKSRNRYLELLAKAENVEATLKVERELERLNTEIDLLKGRLKNYDNQITYSQIDVYLTQKVKPGIVGYVFVGLYESIKWLFVRG